MHKKNVAAKMLQLIDMFIAGNRRTLHDSLTNSVMNRRNNQVLKRAAHMARTKVRDLQADYMALLAKQNEAESPIISGARHEMLATGRNYAAAERLWREAKKNKRETKERADQLELDLEATQNTIKAAQLRKSILRRQVPHEVAQANELSEKMRDFAQASQSAQRSAASAAAAVDPELKRVAAAVAAGKLLDVEVKSARDAIRDEAMAEVEEQKQELEAQQINDKTQALKAQLNELTDTYIEAKQEHTEAEAALAHFSKQHSNATGQCWPVHGTQKEQ